MVTPTPSPRGGGLRPATVAGGFVVAGVVGYLLQRYVNDHLGRLPFPGWPGIALLVTLGCVLIAAGLPIRRWQAGRRDRRLDPIVAFRTLMLARAGALSGGVVAGWYLAHALVLAPDAASASVLRGIGWCLGYVASGVFLIAVGMLLQSWCRVDPPQDDPDEGYNTPA